MPVSFRRSRRSLTDSMVEQFEHEQLVQTVHREVAAGKHFHYKMHAYGRGQTKEQSKATVRTVLLQQTQEREAAVKQERTSDKKFHVFAVEADQSHRSKEQKQFQDHHLYLTKFRDENLKLMELRKSARAANRQQEQKEDRRRLELDPINWSKTLS